MAARMQAIQHKQQYAAPGCASLAGGACVRTQACQHIWHAHADNSICHATAAKARVLLRKLQYSVKVGSHVTAGLVAVCASRSTG